MLPAYRWAGGALVLFLLAGLLPVAIVLNDLPVLTHLGVSAPLLGAVVLLWLGRRSLARPTVTQPRLDLDRLRPGRLRDYSVWANGYARQLSAFAETLPHPAARARLIADLPAVTAATRAVYDLCLSLQAYELAESQPPELQSKTGAEIKAITTDADMSLQATLATLSDVYTGLRTTWSAPAGDETAVAALTELTSLTARLRSHTATFAPAPRAPTKPRAPTQAN